MNDYYKILQVDNEASSEIIEKAYKTLAKKYHPDLQKGPDKIESENMMKIINEAYDVLSDEEKRKQYDAELNKKRELEIQQKNIEQQRKVYQQQQLQQQVLKNSQNQNNRATSYTPNSSNSEASYIHHLNNTIKNTYKQAYNDAYTSMLKNLGYKVKRKRTFKDYLKSFVILILIIFICFLLWHVPFINKFFVNLYYKNKVIKISVDIIKNVITSFVDTLTNFSLLL